MTNIADNPQVLTFIQRSPWFSNLELSSQESMAHAARVEQYEVNRFIYSIGEQTSNIYCIMSGRVRMSLASVAGDEFAVTELQSGAWIGEDAMFNKVDGRYVNMQVKEPATVLKIPISVMSHIAMQQPVIYRNMLESHIRTDRLVYKLLGSMLFYPLKARLAGRIITLLKKNGETDGEGTYLNIKLSQNDFARLSMGSRQRINKIFRSWNEKGIVIKKSDRYFIPNIEALEREIDIDGY